VSVQKNYDYAMKRRDGTKEEFGKGSLPSRRERRVDRQTELAQGRASDWGKERWSGDTKNYRTVLQRRPTLC
jgi:hypothetical protein